MDQPEFKTKSALLLGVLLIILFIGIGYFAFTWKKNHTQSPQNAQQQSGFAVAAKDLSPTQTLSGFPENLPQEDDAQVLQNSELTTNTDGRLQSTKKFTSHLTPKEALVKYSNFFKDLGWESNVSGPIESPALFLKDQNILMIVTRPGTDTEVELTIIQSNGNPTK